MCYISYRPVDWLYQQRAGLAFGISGSLCICSGFARDLRLSCVIPRQTVLHLILILFFLFFFFFFKGLLPRSARTHVITYPPCPFIAPEDVMESPFRHPASYFSQDWLTSPAFITTTSSSPSSSPSFPLAPPTPIPSTAPPSPISPSSVSSFLACSRK